MNQRKTKLVFVSNPMNSLTPDFIVKSAWVSTALALILTLPSLGIFVAIFQTTGSLIAGIIIGFGLHFLLLAKSTTISNSLSKFFD